MENKKSIKVLFAILLSSVMMFSIVATSSFATNTDTTDNNQKVITKAKAATCKVTLNANGGKIGSKKTKVSNVKKGSKIGKQLVTPKRSGYTFNGWYTKKTGGKKITKTTKVSKKVTYYAQWTKNTEASKLVGHWQRKNVYQSSSEFKDYYFYADGTFQYYCTGSSRVVEKVEGKYSVSNGKIYFTDRKFYKFDVPPKQYDELLIKNGINSPKFSYKLITSWSNMVSEYKLGSDNEGKFLLIAFQRSSSSTGDPNFVFSGDRYTNKITW